MIRAMNSQINHKSINVFILAILFGILLPFITEASVKSNAPFPNRFMSGLVGHWTFDGPDLSFTSNTATDRSGKNNTGTLVGVATSTARVPGVLGQGLNLGGSNSYVNIPNSASLSICGSDCGFSAWIYPRTFASYRVVIDNTNRSIMFAINSTTGGYVEFGGTVANGFLNFSPAFTLNEWQHVVVTRSGSTVYVYRNGVLNSTLTDRTGSTNATNAFLIGENVSGGGSDWDGYVDDFKIYNRHIQASEAKALYNLGRSKFQASQNTKKTSGLVGLWSFDGADLTDKIYDRSSTANHGYLYNAATTSSKVSGAIGQGITLDGVDDFVGIPSSSNYNFGSSDFAVSWWEYRTNNASSTAAIVRDNTNLPSFAFGLSNAGSTLGVYITSNGTAWDIANNKSLGSVTQNTWNHFLVTRSGSTFTTYKNGAQTDTWTSSGTIKTSSSQLLFGQYVSNSTTYFAGRLDDVRVYNKAVTASELKNLYNMGRADFQLSPINKLTSGLIGYWTFDGRDTSFVSNTTNDKSGQGRTATLVGMSTTTARVPGVVGQALDFNGTGNYLTFSDTGLPAGSASRSISIWFKNPNYVSGDKYFVTWGAEGGNTNFALGIYTSAVLLLTNGGTNITTNATFSNDDKWHHAAVTYDGSTASIYVDGALDNSGSMTTNTVLSAGNIGSHFNNAYSQDTDASLDEVRIYDRVLSASEVKLLYTLGR